MTPLPTDKRQKLETPIQIKTIIECPFTSKIREIRKITPRNHILIIIICKYTNFIFNHFQGNNKAANDRLR